MLNKLVSIIIPLYNAENYLNETLYSVLSQTYSKWECIIIDDGSTDSSKAIVNKYCKRDKRFKYYYQENAGASSARNRGVDISTGEYIQYLDADDVMLPDKLRLMVKKSEILNENEILYCNMLLGKHDDIHERIPLRFALNLGHDVTFNETYRKFALDFGIIPTCLLFPRKTILNAKWNTELGPGEDWDYYLQILNRNYVFRFFPEVLVLYRDTPDSHSKNNENSIKSSYKLLAYWVAEKNSNFLYFAKRCALLYKRSIFLYLLSKSKVILRPRFDEKNFTFKLYLSIILIYPSTIIFLFHDILKIIYKRIKKNFKNEI
jgi:glycosyltransferase involved in cell wall biosynthesis